LSRVDFLDTVTCVLGLVAAQSTLYVCPCWRSTFRRSVSLDRAIPPTWTDSQSRSGDGLDGLARIGATPAEGDARSAGTSRESPPAPLATQPDEGLDPAIGEQHRSVQAFRGRRRRLRLAPWGLLAPIASPESAAPMCSTCSPRLRRRRCRIQNRDAMLAGSDRRPWPSRSRRTWRSRTTALVANRQPSRRVAEKTKAVPEGRGRARASR
jgi:hypothetical protein